MSWTHATGDIGEAEIAAVGGGWEFLAWIIFR